MLVYWNDGTSLYHYGIPGQRWGVQNGPPYPLGTKQLSSRERHKRYDESRGLKLSDKQKKYIKIGAKIIASGLLLYGAYKLGENGLKSDFNIKGYTDPLGNIDALNGRVRVTDEADRIFRETGLPLRTTPFDVEKDSQILRSQRQSTDASDCGPLALNFCLRWMGLDVTQVPLDFSHEGGLSWGELGVYFRNGVGIKSGIAKQINTQTGLSNSEYKRQLLSVIENTCKDSENACGIICYHRNQSGHFTNWYKENGAIKFKDIQGDINNLPDRLPYNTLDWINVLRVDNQPLKEQNLLNPKDRSIQIITKRNEK